MSVYQSNMAQLAQEVESVDLFQQIRVIHTCSKYIFDGQCVCGKLSFVKQCFVEKDSLTFVNPVLKFKKSIDFNMIDIDYDRTYAKIIGPLSLEIHYVMLHNVEKTVITFHKAKPHTIVQNIPLTNESDLSCVTPCISNDDLCTMCEKDFIPEKHYFTCQTFLKITKNPTITICDEQTGLWFKFVLIQNDDLDCSPIKKPNNYFAASLIKREYSRVVYIDATYVTVLLCYIQDSTILRRLITIDYMSKQLVHDDYEFLSVHEATFAYHTFNPITKTVTSMSYDMAKEITLEITNGIESVSDKTFVLNDLDSSWFLVKVWDKDNYYLVNPFTRKQCVFDRRNKLGKIAPYYDRTTDSYICATRTGESRHIPRSDLY